MYGRRVVNPGAFYGAVRIVVKDIVCSNCDHVNIFNGRSHGIFALFSSVLYSRELLDIWLYQVCAIGASFREAYEA